ncbi:helix-turn-helix domain-containing protein [Leucobacter chromiiresistens]|uniref:AraC-binding-like domain-containing protein n=1 Tax=Leucobacter chromiiresistens TaxID=1079994 RepID=A0A1H0YF31_9MICO|nr:AraC family transcriptional regulator [Leucobacter chromiiresistens]SDQ13571.1 AraC-binding-like domain-containing protein [Leucobacter chromiiresistens]
MPMELLSVRGVDAWQRVASRMFVPLQCRGDGSRFSARVAQRRISPSMWVSRVSFDAHEAERPRALVEADATDHLLVMMQLRGAWTLSQRGRGARLGAGSIAFVDAGEPYRMSVPTRGQDLIVLQLTRESLGLSDRAIGESVARATGAAVPGQAALRALLFSLQSSQLSLDAHAGSGIARAVSDTLAVVMRALTRDAAPEADRRARLAVLQRWLRDHCADPGVTVERLAAHHFLSVRQVHALFAGASDSPAAYLRRVRLSRAAELLEARERSGLTVRAIAEEAGYSDSAAFIRAFTRAYGCSPTRWRAG